MRTVGGALVALFLLVACGDETATIDDRTTTTAATNQPLAVVVEASATEVRVGERITFSVTATDPDAVVKPPGTCRTFHWFGDEEARPAGCNVSCAHQDQYDEIPPTPGELTETFTHVYGRPGTFDATFHYGSDRPCHEGFRYGSEGEATVTVTVLPPE